MDNNALVQQYTLLCAKLGDLLFKQEIAQREINSIRSQLEALAQVNKTAQESSKSPAVAPVQNELQK